MSLPQWKGLFDWSMKYQDGTHPAEWDPSEYDVEKMKWLEGVLKHYMQDFTLRMQQIKAALDTGVAPPPPPGPEGAPPGATAEQPAAASGAVMTLREKELLLEELQDIVSSIDFARDLHKIGGLGTLLDLLGGSEPSLQWRAAEVVATCVANNPPVQQWFLQGGVLPHLLRLLDAPGIHQQQEEQQKQGKLQEEPRQPQWGEQVGRAAADKPDGEDWPDVQEQAALLRTKALLALSGLIRHCPQALEALLQARLPAVVAGARGGWDAMARLVDLAGDVDVRVRRKALSVLQYVASADPTVVPRLLAVPLVAPPPASANVPAAAATAAAGAARAAGSSALVTHAVATLVLAGPHGQASPTGPQHQHQLQQQQQQETTEEEEAWLVAGSDLRQAALELLGQLVATPAGWATLQQSTELLPRLDTLHAALHTLRSEEDRESCCDELAALKLLQGELARVGEPAPGDAARQQHQHDANLGLVAV